MQHATNNTCSANTNCIVIVVLIVITVCGAMRMSDMPELPVSPGKSISPLYSFMWPQPNCKAFDHTSFPALPGNAVFWSCFLYSLPRPLWSQHLPLQCLLPGGVNHTVPQVFTGLGAARDRVMSSDSGVDHSQSRRTQVWDTHGKMPSQIRSRPHLDPHKHSPKMESQPAERVQGGNCELGWKKKFLFSLSSEIYHFLQWWR